jgi:hypothetical protein
MLVSVSLWKKKLFSHFFVKAISGDHSNNMLQQAGFLIDRLKNEKFCDWNNDWKMITIFIGVSQTKINLFNIKFRINI